MKHIKRYNETTVNDLTFNEFRDILNFEIVDELNYECQFNDYSNDESPFFDCVIFLNAPEDYILHDDIPHVSLNYLSGDGDWSQQPTLPPFDGLEAIDSEVFNLAKEDIDDNISELERLKVVVDKMIEVDKKMKILLNKIQLFIPQLKKYPNCDDVLIGFDVSEGLRISFDILSD